MLCDECKNTENCVMKSMVNSGGLSDFTCNHFELKKETLSWRLDTPGLLEELMHSIIENQNAGAGVLCNPVLLLKNFLCRIAQRAIELDDPQLNIIMLEMKLYEVDHYEIDKLVKEQEKRIGTTTRNK